MRSVIIPAGGCRVATLLVCLSCPESRSTLSTTIRLQPMLAKSATANHDSSSHQSTGDLPTGENGGGAMGHSSPTTPPHSRVPPLAYPFPACLTGRNLCDARQPSGDPVARRKTTKLTRLRHPQLRGDVCTPSTSTAFEARFLGTRCCRIAPRKVPTVVPTNFERCRYWCRTALTVDVSTRISLHRKRRKSRGPLGRSVVPTRDGDSTFCTSMSQFASDCTESGAAIRARSSAVRAGDS